MRKKLAFVSALTTLLTVLLLAVPLGFYAHHAYVGNTNQYAATQAETLASLTRDSADNGPEPLSSWIAQQPVNVRATVTLPSGHRYGQALPCPERPRAEISHPPVIWTCGGHRVASTAVAMPGGHRAEVDVAVDAANVSREMNGVFASVALAAVVLPILAALVADRLGRSVVRTAEQLTDVASKLRQGQLDARFHGEGPKELQHLGMTLNTLAARIDALITNEREALADLSHRLRTPITSLMLQAESVTNHEDARRLLTGLSDLNNEVTRIIRLARHPIGHQGSLTARLDAVVTERVAFWSALAEEQDRVCALTVEHTDCWVYVPAPELEAAIDALLENVFTHTPDGTAMRIKVSRNPEGGAAVTLEDDGPGFSDYRVIERGRSTGGSSGLGLDIARRTATMSGGRLLIGEGATGGAHVSLVFGGPAPTTKRGTNPKPTAITTPQHIAPPTGLPHPRTPAPHHPPLPPDPHPAQNPETTP
ncbi:sensor histidine kinase [Streptomyces sp. NPDC091376]|uniref:sensor histidine kinase n=1 Tax=Streptomyces sp. NPDC091376 TaxID=3365994 RepID=UPI003821E8D7